MPDIQPRDVPLLLRVVRAIHDWSQVDLANRAGLAEISIRRYERGESVPPLGRLWSIITARSKFGGMAAAALLLGSTPPKPPIPAIATVTPERLSIEELAKWPQPLFLQADRRGNVSFLRGSGPKFAPLLAGGKLGEPEGFETVGSIAPPLRASMSRDGDWLLFSPPQVRLFRDGKEVQLPSLDWAPIDVGFLRDDPIVNVGTARIRPHPKALVPEIPPLLIRWSGKEWEPFLREALPRGMDPDEGGAREIRTLHILGDSKGTLWLANENLYRIRRYSAGAKLRLEITRGVQTLTAKKNASAIQKRFESSLGNRKPPQGATYTVSAATSRRCLEALAEGRDGKVYFLADEPWEGGSFALDRFDGVTQSLERVRLALRTVGYVSMAAGKDGLYFGSFEPKEGPWRISWDDLDQARWTKLRDVRIDQAEPEPDEDPEASGGVPPAPRVGRRHRSQS